jgi:hypothetical protein
VGIGAASDAVPAGYPYQTKGLTLAPGNYEWPFELLLDGDTTESIEGLREASVIYRLKATVARGKLAHDLHAYKRLRVIRTLEASALEFLHAMSVENIWPNKIEYSIVVPQKAVVFGSCIPLDMRFTPLLKGLELGDITIKLLEIHEIILQTNHAFKEHKKERVIDTWIVSVSRDEHWQDMIDDSGQEGWVVNMSLNLPKKLSRCLQDVNTRGIKIRHKLKLVVSLKNPDGHISELRATLPVSIFISPNMPLDEEGNLVRQLPNATSTEMAAIAPPSYSEHVLDQLYDGMDPTAPHTPTGGRSGVSSPLHGHSRAASAENLAAMFHGSGSTASMTLGGAVSPALLSSRLQSMSLEQHHRDSHWNANSSAGGVSRSSSPPRTSDHSHQNSPPESVPLTRANSTDHSPSPPTPEHDDLPEISISELSKVPSYRTAVRTPIRPLSTYSDGSALPDYFTATSAPPSPQLGPTRPETVDGLDIIAEHPLGLQEPTTTPPAAALVPGQHMTFPQQQTNRSPPPMHRRRTTSPMLVFPFPHLFHQHGDGDERARLRVLQARERLPV